LSPIRAEDQARVPGGWHRGSQQVRQVQGPRARHDQGQAGAGRRAARTRPDHPGDGHRPGRVAHERPPLPASGQAHLEPREDRDLVLCSFSFMRSQLPFARCGDEEYRVESGRGCDQAEHVLTAALFQPPLLLLSSMRNGGGITPRNFRLFQERGSRAFGAAACGHQKAMTMGAAPHLRITTAFCPDGRSSQSCLSGMPLSGVSRARPELLAIHRSHYANSSSFSNNWLYSFVRSDCRNSR
jgi:hypothetical protein